MAVVHPCVVVAVHEGCSCDAYRVVVLELTRSCCVQVGSRDNTIVLNHRVVVLYRDLRGDFHQTRVHQPAVAVGRELVGLDSAMVEDVQTVVQLQLARRHNLRVGCHVYVGVFLQVGGIVGVQRQGGTLDQIQLRVAVKIETAVREVAVTLDIEHTARTVLPVTFGSGTAPDVQIALPCLINIVVGTSHVLCQLLHAGRHVGQKFAGGGVLREIERGLDGTRSAGVGCFCAKTPVLIGGGNAECVNETGAIIEFYLA